MAISHLARVDLSPPQRIVLAVVTDLADENGEFAPGCVEIARLTGFRHIEGVYRNLLRLEERGLIERTGRIGIARRTVWRVLPAAQSDGASWE